MRIICLALALAVSGCSHLPKCGNPEGSGVVLTGKDTCQVRIRQVTVGSDLKIPESLKNSSLSQFTLEWVEPDLKDGRIELGHFVLIQNSHAKDSR
jgi:hypothetical protein